METSPTVTTSLFLSAVGAEIICLLTIVPLVEPRSSTKRFWPISEKRACRADTYPAPITISAPGLRPTMTGPRTTMDTPRSSLGPRSTEMFQVRSRLRWPRTSPMPVFMIANRNR